MLIEVKLKLLIGYIDAELLEGILPKVLKPENIQNSHVQFMR